MNAVNCKCGILGKTYGLLILLGTCLSHIFLLAIRIIWGWQFVQTGLGKLTHLDKITRFFTSLNIPAPHANAIAAALTEFLGGILLVLGLGGRFAAAALTVVMIVAYATAEWPDIHSFDNFVAAAPFPFLFTALVVLCFGPGLISADGILKQFIFQSGSSPKK